ncbi:MAG: SLC13 family permease [Acidobacteriota bacterium]
MMSTPTVTSGAASHQPHTRWPGLAVAVAIGLGVLLAPTPVGLSSTAHAVVAIMAFTVMAWLLAVMNNGVTSVLMMALLIVSGVKAQTALSGFSSPQFWILLSVLYYGFAMQSTGLAPRIAFYILNLFPATYAGILWAFFAIGLLLALGIPSMTVRTAVMVPIAWALVNALGLAARSRGSALIMLSVVEMAVIPGAAFLYGSLWGPLVEGLFQSKAFPLSWLAYAQVMTLPTLVLCALLLVANRRVLQPEAALDVTSTFAEDRLGELGPMSRAEMVTAAVVLFSIAYWATDRLHHLPGFAVGMLALPIFALTDIVKDRDVATGVPWTLLLFVGGIFSLTNVIQEQGVTDWLAALIVPVSRHLTFSPLAFCLAAALMMLVVKLVDPTGFIALTVLFLPLSTLLEEAAVPPLVLTAALLFGGTPFWMSYQSVWVAMCEGITANQAFTGSQRVRLATTYAMVTLATLSLAVGFWKVVGIF